MKFFVFLFILMTSMAFAKQANPQSGEQYTQEDALEDAKICKMFQERIRDHKLNMDKNMFAELTLKSYKKRVDIFCSKE